MALKTALLSYCNIFLKFPVSFQWLLYPIKGGKWHIIPRLAVHTTIPLIIIAFLGEKCYILWCLLRLGQTRFGHVQELYRGAVLFSSKLKRAEISFRSPKQKKGWKFNLKNIGIRTIFFRPTGLLVFFFALKVFLEIRSKGGLLSKVELFFFRPFLEEEKSHAQTEFQHVSCQSEKVDFFESYCHQIKKKYLDMWFAKIFLPNVVPNIASCEILKVSRLISKIMSHDTSLKFDTLIDGNIIMSGDNWMYPNQRTPMGNPYINPI